MTIDEELTQLEESLRSLKYEWQAYFGGGRKRPPTDTEWRVKSLISRHGDTRLTLAQHYRYKSLAQNYAHLKELWRKKMQVREEGYRRPQDALLGIQGVRTLQEHEAERELKKTAEPAGLAIEISDFKKQSRDLHLLYKALLAARKRNAEDLPAGGFDSFKTFVERKTEEIHSKRPCRAVEFAVELEDGHVMLKVRGK